MIKTWNEEISEDMLGSESESNSSIEKIAILYQEELQKLLPDYSINISASATGNVSKIYVIDENGFECDNKQYDKTRYAAWESALKKLTGK